MGPQAVDLLGFPVEHWYRPSFWASQIHPDDRSDAISTCERLSGEGGSYQFSYRMVRADGGVVWVNDIARVEMGEAGPVTLRGFLVDVTEREALAAALKENEERLQKLLQAAPDAMLLINTNGTILQSNRQAGVMFGVPPDELLGTSLDSLIPERYSVDHAAHRHEFAKNPRTRPMGVGLDLVARRHDGSEVPVEVSLSPIEHPEGLQILASVRDITHRKRMEAGLKESERELRLMANSLPALIAMVDQDERYRWVNEKFCLWFGLDQAHIVNRLVREVVGEEVYGGIRPRIHEALRGEFVRYDTALPSAEGSTSPVEVTYVPRFEDQGAVSGFFVIIIDLTERVRAQEADQAHRDALAHVGRVATMGELTASIAHELNQPLSAVVANAQAASRFLGATPPDLGEIGDALGEIAGDAKRAGAIIRHMRDLLRRGKGREEVLDLDALVTASVSMLQSDAIARNVSVTVESTGDLPRVVGDPVQLQQVILNLAVNAFEAVSGGEGGAGALDIRTSPSPSQVAITFTDNGPGLPDEILSDPFAPFVSTKPQGLGMGLSISRTIIEAHGGELRAENTPEGGARLSILLPLTPAEEE